MKFLIWLGCLIHAGILMTIVERATGGAVPIPFAFVITFPVFFIAPALCRKYDESKNKDNSDNDDEDDSDNNEQ